MADRPRFIAHLKSRYEWADEDFQAEWEAAKSNPMAVWAKDEYGEWTVSLLRVATASSARELTSAKGVRQQEHVETDDMEATLSSSLFYLPVFTMSMCLSFGFSSAVLPAGVHVAEDCNKEILLLFFLLNAQVLSAMLRCTKRRVSSTNPVWFLVPPSHMTWCVVYFTFHSQTHII